MDRRAFLVAAGGVLVAPAVASADARATSASRELDALLADVARARATITTLQGPFVQERTVSLMATKVRSTGHVWVVRPDRLRWELDPPDAAVYWVLPDALAYKTKAGVGRIARGAAAPMGGALGDLLTLLGGDLVALRGRYDLALVGRGAGGVRIDATPRDKAVAKLTRRIELELAPDLATIRRVSIVERGTDRSDVTFGALMRGAAVDPKLVAGP